MVYSKAEPQGGTPKFWVSVYCSYHHWIVLGGNVAVKLAARTGRPRLTLKNFPVASPANEYPNQVRVAPAKGGSGTDV